MLQRPHALLGLRQRVEAEAEVLGLVHGRLNHSSHKHIGQATLSVEYRTNLQACKCFSMP